MFLCKNFISNEYEFVVNKPDILDTVLIKITCKVLEGRKEEIYLVRYSKQYFELDFYTYIPFSDEFSSLET